MGQTSSQVVAPTQASQAVPTPAIAQKHAVKRRNEQPNMDSNNVASKRPSKKRRKSSEVHQDEVQEAGLATEQVGAKGDAIDGAKQDANPRKMKKRKIVAHAPADAKPITASNEDLEHQEEAVVEDAAIAAARSKEEKRQRRRAQKARKAREAAEAQANEAAPAGEAIGDDAAQLEDMEVTELPIETIPVKQEQPKSPTAVEWGRQEIRRMLKRKQMEELVLSGQARWHRLPNDKWSIRYYQPGEAPAAAEPSPEQKRRHDIIKQEIATYEHTLRTSEEVERKRTEDAEKENTAPVAEDTATGADHDEDHAHTTGNASSVVKAGPKRKKRRRSETTEASAEEAVGQQPNDPPEESTTAPSVPVEEQEESAEHAKSKKRKPRRSADAKVIEAAEPTSESSKRPIRATRPVPSIKNEERPRKKSKRSKGAVVDDAVVSAEGEGEDAVEVPKSRKRRKRASDVADDNDAAYDPQAEAESLDDSQIDDEEKAQEQKTKKPARTKTRRVSTEKHQLLAKSLQLEIPEATSGPFTVQEQEISDRVFDEVLQRHSYTEAELKVMIKNWRNAGVFKMEIEAALPNRKKDQVRKFCQRRYHAYERGPWTAEQDQALIDANAKFPGKWTQIADLVDRFPTDCKDRWTSYLQSRDSREIGPWNQAEEDALVNAVEECIVKIKKARRKDKTLSNGREELEALVDWNTVAKMLGGKREARRCREKYHKLMARLTKTGSLSQELPASQLQDELNSAAPKSASNKRRSAIAKNALENFEIGDYYDAFVEVHTAIKDHSAQYHDEQMLLWSIVAQAHPASRFNTSYLGAALRRVAIEKALDEWQIDSKKTRRKLDEAPSIPAKALLLAKWVEKRSGDKLETLPRKYMPELIGKSKEDIRQFKKEQQEQRRSRKHNATTNKSDDRVLESDEDEELPVLSRPDKKREAEDGKPSSQKRDTGSITNHDEDDDNEDNEDNDDNDEEAEIEESTQDENLASETAHEVSDTEVDSTHEKVFAASQAARATQGTQEVPETQPEPSRVGDSEAAQSLAARVAGSPDNEVVVSSVNSRVSESPSLSPEDFLQRCRDAGRSQHGDYTSRNRRTYGRQGDERQR